VDHKRNENVVAAVGRSNFPMFNKTLVAEVKKVEIELAPHDGTAEQQLLIT